MIPMAESNMTRRKFLSVAAATGAAAAAFAATGCSSSDGSSSEATDAATGDSGAGSADQTTLQFWCHENEPWFKSYQDIAAKFEEEHPEYHVEVTEYPFDVYNDKIQTALSSSDAGPDIVAVWGGNAPSFIETDALSPVPDDLASDMQSDYLAPTLGIYTKEGTYYGVPMEFNLEYGGLIVNKKLFDEAGLSYPETWKELRQISQDVSESDGDVVTMGGIEMIDGDALICNYLAMILQKGGQYIQDDNSVNFATDEGIEAMKEMVSMVKDGECDLDHLAMDDYCFQDVYEDKAYGCSVGCWAIGEGTDSYGLEYGVDFEYIPTPLYGDEQGFASETGWGIMVPANGANVDAAWEFVKFFSQPENLIQHNIACNQLPPRESLLDSEEYKEALPNSAFLLDILPYGQWMGPYNTSDMRTIFNQTFTELCQSDDPDYESALKDASQQISDTCQISYSMD